VAALAKVRQAELSRRSLTTHSSGQSNRFAIGAAA